MNRNDCVAMAARAKATSDYINATEIIATFYNPVPGILKVESRSNDVTLIYKDDGAVLCIHKSIPLDIVDDGPTICPCGNPVECLFWRDATNNWLCAVCVKTFKTFSDTL